MPTYLKQLDRERALEQAQAALVPNRLKGATINEEGDAV